MGTYPEALLGQELEEGEVVGARGLQGHPGGVVVGQGGQEGLAAFRGVGEAATREPVALRAELPDAEGGDGGGAGAKDSRHHTEGRAKVSKLRGLDHGIRPCPYKGCWELFGRK